MRERDTRISVFDVPIWLAAGMSHGEILKDFPQLTEEDIRACLAYTSKDGAMPVGPGQQVR